MRQLLTAIIFSFISFGAQAQFQGLIVNEFSQGDQSSREYIELLVVGTRTCTDSTADLRGWIFDDQNGWYGTASISTGHYRFANASNWATVPFGSIILFYNSAIGEKNLSITTADDPVDANHDYTYILPINSSAYLEENNLEPLSGSGPGYVYPLPSIAAGYAGSSNTWGSHIALNNGGDVICTVSPTDRTTAYFSIGYNFTNAGGFQTPTVSTGNVGMGNNCYLTSASYNTAGSWLTGNANPLSVPLNETPGNPNGGANTTWINTMRQQATPLAPGINVIQPNCSNATGTINITSPFGPGYSYSNDGVNYGQFNTVFTGLSQGVYSITVKFNGCVSPPSTATINAAPTTPAIPQVTIVQPDCNSPTGTVTINSPTGAGLTYSISGTYQPSNVFTGVGPGPYGVTAKNASGCISIATIISVDPPPPSPPAPVVTITTQPDCSNPTATISVSSPVGMSYSVDGINYTNTTGIFNNLAPGNYNITTKNSFGCVSPATPLVINGPSQMPATPVLAIGQTSCTSATGTIIISSPIGGGLSYSLDGINYSTQTVFNGLLPGNYFVSVQNPIGCTTAAVPVVINPQPPVPATPVMNVAQPTCIITTGAVTINTPTGMNYSIDGIDYSNTTGVFSNLSPGSYNITAQNGGGCISPASNVIINPQPITPSATVNSPSICPGSNATITATTTPAASYTFVWTVPTGEPNPGNVASFNAATAGIYSVAVTSGAGCGTTASGTLSITSVSSVTADDKTVCQNATVQLGGQPAGGTWSGANVTGTVFNAVGLTPGSYPVSYTYISGGCSGTATATVVVASLPAVPMVSIIQPDCVTATGSINFSSPLGAGYSYSIDAINYSANPAFNNLVAANYSVYVQNGAGCITSASAVVNSAPAIPPAPLVAITQPLCFGNTGSISISNPSASLIYSIDGVNYQSAVLFSGVAAGNYNVTAKFSGGCVSAPTAITINIAPPLPPSAVVSVNQPTCSIPTGTISITSPIAGSFSYSIDGTNYQGSPNFVSLSPGSYSVTVKDNNSCVSLAATTIINVPPSAPPTPMVSITQPTCTTLTGSLSIASPSGAGYSYSVDGINYSTNPVFNNLAPASYIVYAQNGAGCISSATAVVSAPPASPPAPLVNITQPVCFGDAGSISIITPVANMLYSIDGVNYQSAGLFNGLGAASYNVTSKFAGGCVSAPTAVTINSAPPLLPLPLVSVNQPTCLIPTGTVTVTSPIASGFIYSIDGTIYQGSPNFVALQPGTYSVTVKDNNGCVSNGTSVLINAAPSAPPTPVVSIVQPTCTTSTGSITISSPWGAGYNYSIDAINYSANPVFNNLFPASYLVSVQNGAGCISSAAVVISAAPVSPLAPVLTIVQPTCTTATGSVTVVSPTGAGLSFSIDGINYQASPVFSNLAAGTYSLSVQNSSGCFSPGSSAVINQQQIAPAIPVVTITQPTCNTPTGSIIVNAPTGTGLTYSIDSINYFSSPIFSQLLPGTYTVRVKNSAGCISVSVVTINQPPAVFSVLVTSSTGQLICPVADGIVVTVTATISVAGTYTYSWVVPNGVTNPGNVPGFVVNTPGQYTLTATNSNGCSVAASLTLNPVPPDLPSYADNKQVCLNSSVTLTSQIPGGTWFGNNVTGSTFNATGTIPGSYPVYYLLTTNSYCHYSIAQVTVLPIPGAPTISVTDNCDGTSVLSASNYTGALLWNNNATLPSITVTTAGNYWVTQTVNGCVSVQAVATASPVFTQVQTQTISGCGSVQYNGNSFTSSSVVSDTLRSLNGCDSIIRIANIIVNQPSSSSFTVCKPAGQTFNFNGTVLNASGQYTDTLVSVNGCDSVVYLHLLIAATQASTISGCESLVYNGITYTNSATLSQTISSIITGCDSIIRITNIVVNPKPVITPMSDRTICKGEVVQLTASANVGVIQWLGFGSSSSITVTPNTTSTYFVTAMSGPGCTDTGSVTVSISQFDLQLTTSNSQVISGTTASLQTSSSSVYQVLSWSPASLFPDQNASAQNFAVDSTVNVMVIAESTQGCRDSAYITIFADPLEDIYIPSAFTPNGDGKNDVFRVLGGNIQTLDLKIFNRWGELIFSSNDRSKGWDGSYMGREQPGAVYVFTTTVILTNGKKISRKGTVTLIR